MKFREDNTEGYDIEQLAELNRRYDEATRSLHPDTNKSILDAVAERVLAQFDAESP